MSMMGVMSLMSELPPHMGVRVPLPQMPRFPRSSPVRADDLEPSPGWGSLPGPPVPVPRCRTPPLLR